MERIRIVSGSAACVLLFLFFPLLRQVLYWLTGRGEDVVTAQYLFLGLYVSLIMLVLSIYGRAGSRAMPLWSILLVCTSRRCGVLNIL